MQKITVLHQMVKDPQTTHYVENFSVVDKTSK